MGKKPVIPPEISEKIISRFLREIETRSQEDRKHDIFGIIALGHLIIALEAIDAEPEHWDKVANFVLGKTTRISAFIFTLTFLSLSPYVSIKMRERIVTHLARYGDLQSVLHLTSSQIHRTPTQKEILSIAMYHREKWTSSGSAIWKSLLTLALEKNTLLIKKMVEEIKHKEDNPSLY